MKTIVRGKAFLLHIKKYGRSIAIVTFSLLYVAISTGTVRAISQQTLDAINNNTAFYNPDDTCTAGGTAVTLASGNGKDTPKWVTTLQAPYSLEDFVVEVLKDIAAKEGVPESATVTQEHVLALIAFAQGEGGNLTNHDIWNPWNTGYSAPDLQPVGGHSTSGVQSYASFNDGVEATARVMTGTGGSSGYQSRIGTTLAIANSTSQQFMKALTYYQDYPNNKAWAELSTPGYGGNPNAQSDYYQGRLNFLATTQTHYNSIASLQLGPPGDSQGNNLHVNKPLRYSFTGDATTTAGTTSPTPLTSCGTTASGVVAGNIVQTAVNLAWDDYPTHGKSEKVPKPEYLAAKNQIFGAGDGVPDDSALTDCGVFVATVMRSSGADTDWSNKGIGSGNMLQYAKDHPEKYTVTPSFTSTADLQPGDILAMSGHIYIYVGPQADGKSVAEASHYDHVPVVDNDPYPSQAGENFQVIRMKS